MRGRSHPPRSFRRPAAPARDNWRYAGISSMIASINPATGETLRTFDALTGAELEDKLTRAERAYRSYRRTSFADRARWLTAAAEILESEKDRLGRIMTVEMGKTSAPSCRHQ